ncbi:MAG: HAMP domain-containing sensor histidine kinase [Burkholderiaceae bacterium]|nr:HAMP domain-containing sensor histidine kinase [Burkholderiaceae bacterium]
MTLRHSTLPNRVTVFERARFSQAQVPAATTQDHADWVQGESIRAFMPTQQQTQIIALFVFPVVFLVLYEHVYMPGLIIWLVLSVLLAIYRWRLTMHYTRHLSESDTATQLQFMTNNAWTWPLTSLLWSVLVWLFFSKAPLFNQLVCFVILASIGVFSATGYAPHLKTMKLFINAMMISLLAGMTWHYFTNTDAAEASMVYAIFSLELVFWMALLRIGARLNKSHLLHLDLLKGNYELIDSLKEQTRRANQAVETKNRFLASAAHDIRQPVLALDLYASLLRTAPDMVAELTPKIGIATKSVIDMFDSLFDLSRLETGQLKINSSAIDVPGLMRELELQYQPVAQAKNLALRLRMGSCDIHTDHQLLKRILGNLIMNAIKFTQTGGVLLACRRTPRGVRFEVWDTGVGIGPDQHIAVFREFYKSPANMGTSEGFGLGLSIVARLCEPLGFDYSMRSRVGRGSVFCIEVPSQAS